MSADPRAVIVMANRSPACPSVHAVLAHHRDFPEILGEGETPEQAATGLLGHLTAALDSVGSERHRGLVERAIGDVRAYLATLPRPARSARWSPRPHA